MIEFLISVGSLIVTLSGAVLTVYTRYKKFQRMRSSVECIVALPPKVPIIDEVAKLPDFTSYRKGVNSGFKKFLWHAPNLSAAYKLGDIVLFDEDCDVKTINVTTAAGREKLRKMLDLDRSGPLNNSDDV